MALSHYLSAIRELILDDPPGAAPVSLQRETLAQRFPRLSTAELDDLASLPARRLRIYTDLVFSGERGLLEWACPMTLAMIARLRAQLGDSRADGELLFDLVRELHRFRAWRKPSVRELTLDFADFVRERLQELQSVWGGLVDLAEFERHETELFYALDPPGAAIGDEELLRLGDRSVPEFLALRVLLPEYAVIRRFAFDPRAVASAWRESGALPSELPAPRTVHLAGGRSPATFQPRWLLLDETAAAALPTAPRGVPLALETLAEAYVSAPSAGGSSETDLFRAFFALVRNCFDSGVLLQAT